MEHLTRLLDRGDLLSAVLAVAMTVLFVGVAGFVFEKLYKEHKERKRLGLAGTIWIGLGMVCGYYVAIDGVDTLAVVRAGADADARVIGIEEEVTDEGIIRWANYEFRHRGKSFGGWIKGSHWKVGDELIVHYSPEDPTKNRAEGIRSPLVEYLFRLLLGGGAATFALFTGVRRVLAATAR